MRARVRQQNRAEERLDSVMIAVGCMILAWIFVLARLVHAYIHTGSNVVLHRSMAIGVSAIALVAMWVIFAVRILITGA